MVYAGGPVPQLDTMVRDSPNGVSGGGQGDACVEIANLHTRIAIRDSKDRARAPLSFPTEAFATFLTSLKASTR